MTEHNRSYTQIDLDALERQMETSELEPWKVRGLIFRLREAEANATALTGFVWRLRARIAQLERVRTEALKAPYFGPLTDALDALEATP